MKQLLLTAVLFITVLTKAQVPPTVALENIQKSQSNLSIFIHSDKDFYYKGEQIWFKAYVLEQTFPTAEAQNLIVRLIGEDGALIEEKKYPILGATVPGNFLIPDTLFGSRVTLQAFTPSTSANPDLWFMKKYDLLHKTSLLETHLKNQAATAIDTIIIRFFPEGGHLVPRVKNNVAFEALDKYGLPVDVSFKIVNSSGQEIKRVKSLHNGMGSFDWSPTALSDFNVQLVTPNNVAVLATLPPTNSSGLAIAMTNDKNVIKYAFSKAPENKTLDTIYLLIHQNKTTLKYLPFSFDDYQTIEGGVNLTNITTGLVHFTIFNKQQMPIAERIVFINTRDVFTKATLTATNNLGKRSANTIKIELPPNVQATASMAITDADGVPKTVTNDNIFSYLLLSKYIRGYIHEPSYYFTAAADGSREKALDLVMLTHGFKKYNWVKALNGVVENEIKNDNPFITLTGNVFEKDSKRKLAGGVVNAIFKYSDGENTFENAGVNDKGEFVLDSIIARGKTEILFSYTNAYGETQQAKIQVVTDSLEYWSSTTEWVIDSLEKEIPKTTPFVLAGIVKDAAYVYKEAGWANGKVVKMAEVTVVAQRPRTKSPKELVDARYARGAFSTQARKVIDLVNTPHPNYTLSVWDYIKIYLPVDAYGVNDNMSIKSRTMFSLQTGVKYDVETFLDEVLLSQGSGLQLLNNIPIEDVGLIKYWGNGFIGSAGNAPGGALAIYTKSPQDRNKTVPSPINKYKFNGYNVVEEFYSPDYSTKDKRHSATDTRTTLFWTPNIITDGQNQVVEVKYHNNDFSKKLRIILQGVTLDGKLFYEEKIIE